MRPRALCICTSNRPDRVKACLESIQENDHDLLNWTLFVSMEPGNPEVEAIIKAVDWMPIQSWINGRKLGPTLNTFMVYNIAFNDMAEAALYIDDDMILSPDAIDLCNWYLASHAKDKDVAGLCLCTNYNNNPSRPHSIASDLAWVGLIGQGFCITAHQWFHWVKRIFFTHKTHFGGDDYDWAIAHSAIDEKKKILRPRFSRSQHTGIQGHHGSGKIFPNEINRRRAQEFVLEEK